MHAQRLFSVLRMMLLPQLSRSFIRSFSSTRLVRCASTTTLNNMAPKQVLTVIADGSEEIESVTVIDTLVRAGAIVTTASVGTKKEVVCSRGVKLVADQFIQDCMSTSYDLIVLPGGMPGATNLRDCVPLQHRLVKQHADGKMLAAICAAPAVVLQPLGILTNKMATCYPAPKFRGTLQPEYTSNDAVVRDGNVITSQGPGSSLKFSLLLVEALYGVEVREKVAKEMLSHI